MRVGNAEQFADGGDVRLTRARTGALGQVEHEVRWLLEELLEECPASTEAARPVSARLERGRDRIDRLGRLVLLETILRAAAVGEVRAQVVGDPDLHQAGAASALTLDDSLSHQLRPASGKVWIGS